MHHTFCLSVALSLQPHPRSAEEAEALRVLLEQQSAGGGGFSGPLDFNQLMMPDGFDPLMEPGTELSLQDLDRMDQGSPDHKQHRAATAAGAGAAGAKSGPKSPTRTAMMGTAATSAAADSGLPPPAPPSGRRANWPAGGGLQAQG